MEEDQDSSHNDQSVISIGTELKDDIFSKLVDDFLGSQTGEELDLDEKPCKNRLLIQVGLMRELNNLPWVAVVKWLQKIFPVFQSADFHCLIERNITTALSLTGDAREAFLESNVNFEFVGPLCDSIGIGRTDLLEMSDFSERAGFTEVTNGLMLELSNFVAREKIDSVVLVSWLRNFDPQFCSDGKIQKANRLLQSRLKKFKVQHHNYQRSRYRRNGLMEKFLQSPFDLGPSETDAEVRRVSLKSQMQKKRLLTKLKRKKPLRTVFKEENEAFTASQNHDGSLRPQVKFEQTPNLIMVKEERDDPSSPESHQITSQTEDFEEEHPDAAKGEPLTLLDVSVLSVQKLSSMYGGKSEGSKLVSLDLLKNQFALMLEEDSHMKALNEQVLALKDTHSLASPLNFLHYNTHFLLDLSDAVEQQVMAFEREIIHTTGEKLGRDNNPKFYSFVNFPESAASRYIRMASDILSPRGEIKSNYRRHWLAFCLERNNPSRLPVNQSNRFNNYFEAAAGLTHHFTDVALFFSDVQLLNDTPNIILDSVYDDANDEAIQALLCVLAIVYCKVLGPYWQLLKSSAQYSLYSRYILCLYQKLLQWSEDASSLLVPEFASNVFLQVPLQEKTFEGVFAFCGTNADNQYGVLMKTCLEKIMKVIAAVTEANLKDFLPGGVYCQEPTLELANQLETCTFSHLMGDYPFGHAYPYQRKRPDLSTAPTQSSTAVFSSVLDNGPESSEEMPPPPAPRGKNTMVGKKKKGLLKVKKKSLKFAGMERRDARPKQYGTLMQDLTNKNTVIAAVTKNGGPCKSKQEVDRLLAKLDGATHAQKREAIRCEISYQKLVLGSRDNNLNHIGFSLSDMVNKLKRVLPMEPDSYASPSTQTPESNIGDDPEHLHQDTTQETASAPSESQETAQSMGPDNDHVKGNSSINLGRQGVTPFLPYRENFDLI